MLTALSIKNFALIDHLQVDFNTGFTIITGETGAGKSILLGGLSLILGKRADLSSLRDTTQKCIIEATFSVINYDLESFFLENDLDYESQTIIRREILPSGKSRAFINDSPVNLSSLQLLGSHLIDIHSQHQTLQLVDDTFQFQVIDALAKTQLDLEEYASQLKTYKQHKKELETLTVFQAGAIKEHDYNSFQLKELVDAQLIKEDLSVLEEEYETLNNIEDITEKLSLSHQLLSEDQLGILPRLTTLKNTVQKLVSFSPKYDALFTQINSNLIDLSDVLGSLEELHSGLAANPNRLEIVNGKLTTINNLMQKHVVQSIPELITIKESLSQKIAATESVEEDIIKKQDQINKVASKLNTLAKTINKKRTAIIPELKKQLEHILSSLGMPNALFDINLELTDIYFFNGKETLSFLFSANKGGQFNVLKKAASGGELSRIMLTIKFILSKHIKLPTIMFDEIDTGVSGEISNKMGEIMSKMSTSMQVFSITHLPQIAAKGHSHYKVYKRDINEVTTTNLSLLNHDERIVEIAQMLGGIDVSNSAIAHAKQLLN